VETSTAVQKLRKSLLGFLFTYILLSALLYCSFVTIIIWEVFFSFIMGAAVVCFVSISFLLSLEGWAT